jgi:hypothetical protein
VVVVEKGSRTFAHAVSCPEMKVPKGMDRDLTGTPLLWRHVAKQMACDLASREATHKFSKPKRWVCVFIRQATLVTPNFPAYDTAVGLQYKFGIYVGK